MNRREFGSKLMNGIFMLAMPSAIMDTISINIDNHNAIRINALNMIDYFLNNKMKHIYEFSNCTRIELLKQGYFGKYFDTAVFMGKVPVNKIQYGIIQSPLPDRNHPNRKINILWSEKINDFSNYIKMDWTK